MQAVEGDDVQVVQVEVQVQQSAQPVNEGSDSAMEGAASNPPPHCKGEHLVHHRAAKERLALLPRLLQDKVTRVTAGHGQGQTAHYKAGLLVAVCKKSQLQCLLLVSHASSVIQDCTRPAYPAVSRPLHCLSCQCFHASKLADPGSPPSGSC